MFCGRTERFTSLVFRSLLATLFIEHRIILIYRKSQFLTNSIRLNERASNSFILALFAAAISARDVIFSSCRYTTHEHDSARLAGILIIVSECAHYV